MLKYKGMEVLYDTEEEKKLLEKVIDQKYKVLQEYKNDQRTYVAKIEIAGKAYILKKPYTTKFFKKVLSIFKKGESVTVFQNVKEVRKEGFDEVVDVRGAAFRKQGGILAEEFYIMDCAKGEIYIEDEKYLLIVERMKKLHGMGRYHGDCNPYNFLIDGERVNIIDTKLKKMFFGNYRAHYDLLTLMKYFEEKITYPYPKNLFYYMALLVRKKRN